MIKEGLLVLDEEPAWVTSDVLREDTLNPKMLPSNPSPPKRKISPCSLCQF